MSSDHQITCNTAQQAVRVFSAAAGVFGALVPRYLAGNALGGDSLADLKMATALANEEARNKARVDKQFLPPCSILWEESIAVFDEYGTRVELHSLANGSYSVVITKNNNPRPKAEVDADIRIRIEEARRAL